MPVIGHIGLTPQSASALGGFTVQGKTPAEAEQLIADAKALDEAGVFAMVLECIPAGVAKIISESVVPRLWAYKSSGRACSNRRRICG